MSAWTVFEPKGSAGRTPGALVLRDRFSIPAFVLGPVWLLWNRLWIEAAATIALLLAFGVLERSADWALAGNLLPLLLAILVGLEGPERRAARLRRLGWREAGIVVAGSHDEAELRYYAGATERAGLVSSGAGVAAVAPRLGSFGGFFGFGKRSA